MQRCAFWKYISIIMQNCFVKLSYQVIWKRLFNTDSNSEGGTMRQMQLLINRSNLKTSPKDDMNAAEDLMEIINCWSCYCNCHEILQNARY